MFIVFVVDTEDKFTTCIVDTGEKEKEAPTERNCAIFIARTNFLADTAQ